MWEEILRGHRRFEETDGTLPVIVGLVRAWKEGMTKKRLGWYER